MRTCPHCGKDIYRKPRSDIGLKRGPYKSRSIKKLPHNVKWFEEHLSDRFGKQILIDFEKVRRQPFIGLSAIAKKYKITRERARQIHKKLYSEDFHIVQYRKNEKIKQDFNTCLHDPRRKIADFKLGGPAAKGARWEKFVMDKCEKLGFEIKPHCSPEYDLNINGFKVDVKSRYTSNTSGKNGSHYYGFHVSEKQFRKCDFIICILAVESKSYIIPIEKFTSESVFIRKELINKHPWGAYGNNWWEEYEEAWNLLQSKGREDEKATDSGNPASG